MKISYKKLWKILIDKNLKRKDLKEMTNLSSASIAKLGKNEAVTLDVLMRICSALDCSIGDIIEFINDGAN